MTKMLNFSADLHILTGTRTSMIGIPVKKKQTGRKELKNDMQLYSKGHILRLLQRV